MSTDVDGTDFVGTLIGAVIVGPLLQAWFVMLAAGAIHIDVWHALPDFSFWQSVLITVALNILGGFFKATVSS